MKVYEYARKRNIKSKDVVKKLHEIGFDHVKNHLSLVPEKVIDQLDAISFDLRNKVVNKVARNIGIVSMECNPFYSRGLGDMVRNKVLQNKLNGNNLIVVLPLYDVIKDELDYVTDFVVEVYHKAHKGSVYKYTYEEVDYFFIDSDYYFGRERLYGYYDDAERFAFLSKGSIALFKYLNMPLDVLNAHDWPLGLYPLVFNEELREEMPNTRLEFSVYGATYQGIYGVEVLTDVFGLNRSYYDDHTVEYAKSVNFLKTALVTADKVDVNKVALNDLKNSYLKEFVYDNM